MSRAELFWRMATLEPFVLNFAPTGIVPRRDDSPHVPLDPSAIAEQVLEAAALGITVVHLHARNEKQEPTADAGVYAQIIGLIRKERPDLVICVSLSGRVQTDFESRAAVLQLTGDLKPDMGSLTLSSVNFAREASVNSPETVIRLAREMLVCGVAPELEVFDTGMINYAGYLAERGWLRAPFYFNFVLGNAATAQATPLTLGSMLAMLPQPCLWAAAGIGRAQKTAQALALASGGGVRTGLEDNLFLNQARTTLATNLDLVRQGHELGAALERPVMSPAEFRQRMALLPGMGSYGREAVSVPDFSGK
jgi:uncharacterized protein (DUF849 family)